MSPASAPVAVRPGQELGPARGHPDADQNDPNRGAIPAASALGERRLNGRGLPKGGECNREVQDRACGKPDSWAAAHGLRVWLRLRWRRGGRIRSGYCVEPPTGRSTQWQGRRVSSHKEGELNYRLRSTVVHQARGGWHLFWDQETVAWTITDQIGASALESLRSPRTLNQVAAEIATQTGYSVREVRPEVARLIESAVGSGLIETDRGHCRAPDSVAGDGVPHPEFLYLHLTSRCNLRCSYCYASPGPNKERERRDLPFAVAREVLRQAQGLGVQNVVVTGGEPLLHPQAVQILEEAKRLGQGVNLLTNGLLIEPSLARRLAIACDQITISLDSADPTLHDLHRGRGAHARASRAIAILNEVGFPHVVVAAVLTCHNQHERYEDFAAYATSLGAERVSRQVYILQGAHRDETLRLDFDSFLACLAQELDAAVAQAQPRGERPSAIWRDRCGAASGVVAIGADGVVYPCQGLIRSEFAAGSIREDSLDEIYAHARVLKEVRAITVADIPGCSGCECRFLCGGGCRALAYNTSGCLSAPIPPEYCAFARLLAEWKLWGAALHQISLSAPAELTL